MKNILIVSSLGILAALAFGKRKVNQTQIILDNIKFKVHKIKGFKLNLPLINIDLDLRLENKSSESFNASTGNYINLKKLEFFTESGIKIGEAIKTINDINLQPNSYYILEDIAIQADTKALNLQMIINLITNKPHKIVTKAYINVLGKEIII